ncbi:hypothetical protein BSKO_06582 [Bryopsis sp. KO-2023]|nr:hypothetical protein BSKO_06582 [Bryopsis sp. KO-2023]
MRPPPSKVPGAPGGKLDFNGIPAPASYVPGLGRGATGFTTRSDIGPARMAPEVPSNAGGNRGDNEEEDELDDSKFDEFMGNDSGMLAGTFGEYDEDDKEADEIWEAVDQHMDMRRRDRREKRLKDEIEKFRAENPKITEQFADLKRKLGEMSSLDWESIPDIGDYTVKKQRKFQSFVPVPDTLLAKAAAEKELVSKIDPGLDTPLSGTASTMTDLTAVGEGRGTVIKLKLDTMADSVSGQTVVDPKGYLTDLKSMKITSDAEISDIKKARLLLKSVIQTNQRHAPGWIAAARLEEMAGRLQAARQTIQEGCEKCPTSEDVWLEAARLQPPDKAKAVLARGVAHNPTSVKLWMQAARLEKEDPAKSRVLRKALERIPNSVRLWKAAVELADEDDARLLLSRAVECCPQHVELWMALTRLETYENAKKVLNKARQAIPTDPSIWITAAKLEEAQGNLRMVKKLITRGVESLQANGVVIDREFWLREAENAERANPPMVSTSAAIVEEVIGLGVEEEDRQRTWMADAEESERRGSVQTARAIYHHAIGVFPGQYEVWRGAAQLERSHGTRESLDELLLRAVKYCPQAEVLWLMAAKEKWMAGDVQAARQILASAFEANPDSEEIYLAAFKLEFENSEPERARAILEKARDTTASTPRVWMKSAMVERELGNRERQREVLLEGLTKFPFFAKLWLMLGQLEETTEDARAVYRKGVGRCLTSVALWKAAAKLEEDDGKVMIARNLLEQARKKNPKNPELWLAAIRTERRAGHTKEAESLLAKALQDCPTSGILLSEAIRMSPRAQRKGKCADALKRCDNDPHVIAAVAELFLSDRKIDKARNWLTRAVTLDPDIGDHWALLYKLEFQHGTLELQTAILKRAAEAQPHHGERWCIVAKDPKNAHQSIEYVLKKVLAFIEKTPLP